MTATKSFRLVEMPAWAKTSPRPWTTSQKATAATAATAVPSRKKSQTLPSGTSRAPGAERHNRSKRRVEDIPDWRVRSSSPQSTPYGSTPSSPSCTPMSLSPSPLSSSPLLKPSLGEETLFSPSPDLRPLGPSPRRFRAASRKSLFPDAPSHSVSCPPSPNISPSLGLSAQAVPFRPSLELPQSRSRSGSSASVSSTTSSTSAGPTAGKLKELCSYLFCQAYGLRGVQKRPHAEVIRDAQALTGCSVRAIQEVLYGHSYGPNLDELRAQIPCYPEKVPCRRRAEVLEELLASVDNSPLFSFDGNNAAKPAEAETAAAPSL